MKLIFLRHGETAWNREGKLQGTSDIPLSSVGIRQAKEAAVLMRDLHPDAVFVSPRKRALQTAEIVTGNAMPIRTDSRLAEWNFGILEGTAAYETKQFRQMWKNHADRVPGAEKFEEVYARVSSFLEEQAASYPNGTLLVVAHGGVSAAVCVWYCGEESCHSFRDLILPNAVPVLFSERGTRPVLWEGNHDF